MGRDKKVAQVHVSTSNQVLIGLFTPSQLHLYVGETRFIIDPSAREKQIYLEMVEVSFERPKLPYGGNEQNV